MIDLKLVRANPAILKKALHDRNYTDREAVLSAIASLDQEWREIKSQEDTLRAERNKLSLEINELKKSKKDAQKQIDRSKIVAEEIKAINLKTEDLENQLKALLLTVPNIPDASVNVGKDETENKELRHWGKPRKKEGDVLSHDELGTKTGWLDFDRGSKLGGHRFTVIKGPLAKLERALINFMLATHTSNGYTEIIPPHLVKTEIMQGTGQLPKFKDDLYSTQEDLWLIPTSEVPVTNLFANEVLEEKQLPIKFTAYTPCYRKEAGAYGKDIKGIIRQHQFNKVELVKFAHPENSFKELESLTHDAERILQALELPYRTIKLCTGDMGFASARTHDIEVWVPSQGKYREISSCSNCTDFQARRANIRFRGKTGLEFVHTLNGSGLAVGRTMVAILENYQEKDCVKIPKVLQDFMGCEELTW